MSDKYTTTYKTFESLMSDIQDDLNFLDAEGYIMPDKHLKVVEKCNSTLSIKINPVKEDVITVKKGLNKLPADFKLLEKIYVCNKYTELNTTLNFNIDISTPVRYSFCDIQTSCNHSSIQDTKGVMSFSVRKRQTGTWLNISALNLTSISSSPYCNNRCSRDYTSNYNIRVVKDKENYYLDTNFEGEVFIVYVSTMQDDDGNLLLLDHPLVQEYYEYSIKERIYEELWLNGIEEYKQKLDYISQKLRIVQMDALRFVRMFDFAELKQVYFDNRKRAYLRYDKIIQE